MLGGWGCLLLVPPHFCWGGVGAAKGLLPCFLVPKGNQPTACTLALWWLKFGPTELARGGGGALQLHYVPSQLNPADPVSRWFSGQTAKQIVVQARAVVYK